MADTFHRVPPRGKSVWTKVKFIMITCYTNLHIMWDKSHVIQLSQKSTLFAEKFLIRKTEGCVVKA